MMDTSEDKVCWVCGFLLLVVVAVMVFNLVWYQRHIAPTLREIDAFFAYQDAILAKQKKLIDTFRPSDRFVIWFDNSPSERYCQVFRFYKQDSETRFIVLHVDSLLHPGQDDTIFLFGNDAVHLEKGCP